MYCVYCGKENDGTSRYCMYCGALINPEADQTADDELYLYPDNGDKTFSKSKAAPDTHRQKKRSSHSRLQTFLTILAGILLAILLIYIDKIHPLLPGLGGGPTSELQVTVQTEGDQII